MRRGALLKLSTHSMRTGAERAGAGSTRPAEEVAKSARAMAQKMCLSHRRRLGEPGPRSAVTCPTNWANSCREMFGGDGRSVRWQGNVVTLQTSSARICNLYSPTCQRASGHTLARGQPQAPRGLGNRETSVPAQPASSSSFSLPPEGGQRTRHVAEVRRSHRTKRCVVCLHRAGGDAAPVCIAARGRPAYP